MQANQTGQEKAQVSHAEINASEGSSPAVISRSHGEDGVCTLCFDDPDRSANVLDADVLLELGEHLEAIAGAGSGVTGVVITSAKPNIFIAGADLKKLQGKAEHPDQLDALIQLGQNVFDKLAALDVPTVAAIRGACAGGGFELALACDRRVAADDRGTRIGLPETQLGLLPAWGGSTRLPALVGLPVALGVILGGKLHSARAALRKGMVDAVVSPEHLGAAAGDQLGRGKRSPARKMLLHSAPVVALIRRKAIKDALARTRGNYPAIPRAIEVVCASVRVPHGKSLEAERSGFLDLVGKAATGNLIGLFFQTEKARRRVCAQQGSLPLKRVAVIGAGVMGSGIAQWLAARGCQVLMKDISPAALAAGMTRVDRRLDEAVARHLMTRVEARAARDRIWPACGEIPLGGYDLVIEAATEDLELKRRIFADLVAGTTQRTILATNTSALPIRELTEGLPGGEAGVGRVLGLHFFNPVHRMKLVEVVRPVAAREEVVVRAADFVRQIGKLPVVVADEPGFLVNRILLPYLLDAARLFEEGVSAREIDSAMLDFGMPMGPLRLLDEVGLDVGLHVAGTLVAAHPERLAIPAFLENLVGQGALGRKAGRGFYLYGKGNKGKAGSEGEHPEANPEAAVFEENSASNDLRREAICHRLAGHLSQEARLCLDEGIAESGEEIDFAMVMGTGYAPFRGGPVAYAEKLSSGGKEQEAGG